MELWLFTVVRSHAENTRHKSQYTFKMYCRSKLTRQTHAQ